MDLGEPGHVGSLSTGNGYGKGELMRLNKLLRSAR